MLSAPAPPLEHLRHGKLELLQIAFVGMGRRGAEKAIPAQKGGHCTSRNGRLQ